MQKGLSYTENEVVKQELLEIEQGRESRKPKYTFKVLGEQSPKCVEKVQEIHVIHLGVYLIFGSTQDRNI
jgi:hypothetical protein